MQPMDIFSYSRRDKEAILKEFSSDSAKGLSAAVAARRLADLGLNRLAIKEVGAWHVFWRQFKSSFIYLLLAAMAITLFLGEFVDAIMVSVFLFVNVGLGFFQEYRSEKTVKLLNKYTRPRAKVLRGGKVEQADAEKLVPGDVVVLETGDKVSADCRLIEECDLVIDETILTGESAPVYKDSMVLKKSPSGYHQAVNLVFSGTDVMKGWGKAVVVATGKDTAFGQIAKLTGETRKVSDFEKGISRFSQFIIKMVGITIFLVFLANILIKRGDVNIFDLIIFSVALTVSVIPEALPLVTTFSLAQGAHRLAKNKVIVKRLSAIEDLGGIEILCSDKTGTLTENELKVANIHSGDHAKTIFLANVASAFEEKRRVEPFDIALEKELSGQQAEQLGKSMKLSEEPFDPRMRRNVVLAESSGKRLLVTRGAPEEVIEVCSGLDDGERSKIEEWIVREGKQGHRVLAVAYKEGVGISEDVAGETMLKTDDFCFSGIISFVDPIKSSSFRAARRAKRLGVRMVVLTGDSREVAGSVAKEIGLIDSPDKVVTADEWERMKTDRRRKCLDHCMVFARVSPEQKFKIIEFLQAKYSVGFLGEGINDAPALKIAGVSLVVDSSVDIAREAADIILLKKNLEVILDGIEEGRKVFANTTKYIKSTLSSNFGNFFAVASSSLLIDFLPMLPIQLLLVNLLSDTPMISISTDSVDKDELESPKKYEAKEAIILSIILGVVSMLFDFIFFGLFFRHSPEVLRTNWFIGSILTEVALIFSIRTKSLFLKGSRPSASIIWLSLSVFIITLGLPFTSFGQNVFRFAPPSLDHAIMILSLIAVYFVCTETVKLLYYKNKAKVV